MRAGVIILAGGEATRLPGKLELSAGELPMIARVFANVGGGARETFFAGKHTFAPEIDALLTAPLVVDRWRARGPLGGLLTTMARMRSRVVFAVAGDAPFVDAAFLDALAAQWRNGDEALVPQHTDETGKARIEPLAALYDRLAFLREGIPVLRSGRGALRLVLDRLQTRFVTVAGGRAFTNVNTSADYAALRAALPPNG